MRGPSSCKSLCHLFSSLAHPLCRVTKILARHKELLTKKEWVRILPLPFRRYLPVRSSTRRKRHSIDFP